MIANKTRIVLLCVGAAVLYGVVHDQITARLCLEYFTVAYPDLFPTSSPTLLALCWGIATTFGIGAIFGGLLAAVAEQGPAAPLTAAELAKPIARLLLIMAAAALGAGLCGYFLTRSGTLAVPGSFAESISPERQARFMAVWFAHGASYLAGLAGADLLIGIWKSRGRPVVIALMPRGRAASLRAVAVIVIAALILWIRFRAHE